MDAFGWPRVLKGVLKKKKSTSQPKTSGWMKWYFGLEIVKSSEDSSFNSSPFSCDDSSQNGKRSEELCWYHRVAHDQHFPFIWSDFLLRTESKVGVLEWTSQISIDSWYATLEKKPLKNMWQSISFPHQKTKKNTATEKMPLRNQKKSVYKPIVKVKNRLYPDLVHLWGTKTKTCFFGKTFILHRCEAELFGLWVSLSASVRSMPVGLSSMAIFSEIPGIHSETQ